MRRILLAVALTAGFAPTMPANLFDPLQTLLSVLWDAPSSLDAGCGMDPSGRCVATQLQPDEGCGFDPNGRCQPGS